MSLVARVRGAFERPPSAPMLSADMRGMATGELVPAAVLAAITDRPEPGLLLTVRRENMRTHAGQVAFPGGRIDPGETPLQAALREAEEEIGLGRQHVEIIGTMNDYATGTNYRITPVIGLIPPDLPLFPHEREVADWFEVPLAFALDPLNHRHRSKVFAGKRRRYYQIDWNGYRIWGATASMIVNLSRRVGG